MATMKKGKKIALIIGGVVVVAVALFYFVPAVRNFVTGMYQKVFKKKVGTQQAQTA